MGNRVKNRALKKRRHGISKDDLHPNIASGLTEGLSAQGALEQFPVTTQRPLSERIGHMRDDAPVEGLRVPRPHFHAEEDADTVWLDEPTGRLQKNVNLTFPKEVIEAIKSGFICLRCLEPQDEAFPEVCQSPPEMGCTYPIKERQILDFSMEFEGDKHLGPARPIREYLEEQEERAERARSEMRTSVGFSMETKILSPGAARDKFSERQSEKKVILPPGVDV